MRIQASTSLYLTEKSTDCRLRHSSSYLICDKWSILQLSLQILSIMKICIKVAPKTPVLDRFHMLKASGTFAKDYCTEQAILLLQEQKCILKNLRLLYIQFPTFLHGNQEGQIWGIFPYLGYTHASDYPLTHQTGHK